MTPPRNVLVIGGGCAGLAAALAARRRGAHVHLVFQGCAPPPRAPPIPEAVDALARDAARRFPVPAPEPAEVFGLRARRLRRWLDELSIPNEPGWNIELHQHLLHRCEVEGVGLDDRAVATSLLKGPGIGGAVLLAPGLAEVAPAEYTIVACGDTGFLGPTPTGGDPPAGQGLLARAGVQLHAAPTPVRWRWDGLGPLDLAEDPTAPLGRSPLGVAVDGRGQTRTPGLAAAGGSALAPWSPDPQLAWVEDVVRGHEAGGVQPHPVAPVGGAVPPNIDAPLPAEFATVKLDRLRALVESSAGGSDVRPALIQYRGELQDQARARWQPELHQLALLSEAALALVTGWMSPRQPASNRAET